MQIILMQVMNYANNSYADDKYGWLSGKVRFLVQGEQVRWGQGQIVVLELQLQPGAQSRKRKTMIHGSKWSNLKRQQNSTKGGKDVPVYE